MTVAAIATGASAAVLAPDGADAQEDRRPTTTETPESTTTTGSTTVPTTTSTSAPSSTSSTTSKPTSSTTTSTTDSTQPRAGVSSTTDPPSNTTGPPDDDSASPTSSDRSARDTGSSSTSSTSTSAAESTSTTAAATPGLDTTSIGCPPVLASGANAGTGGFPLVGLTVGSAGGGLLLALVLVARRRLFASGAFLLAAVAVMASLAAPSARAQAAEDHEAVARATFSGLAGEVMVLDVSPDVDLNDRELPTLDAPWSIIKPLDQASPRLIDAVATGEEFRCVEFRFLTPDDQAVQGLIALAGVHVVKVRHVADGGEPVEHVELHYSRLAYRYRPQRPDGSLGPAVEGTRRGGPVG